jgi:hypothetical protein
MILFLLSFYYWVAPDGRIDAILQKSVRNHSGYTCMVDWTVPPEVQKNCMKYKYDNKTGKFVERPKLEFTKTVNNVTITSADTTYKIEIVVMGDDGVETKILADKGISKDIGQAYTIRKIAIKSRLSYPETIWMEAK